jgi:hypothetical protein
MYSTAAMKKHAEKGRIEGQQDEAEHYKIECRKQHLQGRVGEEGFDAALVADALKQVAGHFGVEIADGQPSEFGKEIVDHGHVHAGAGEEQDAALDELHSDLAEKEHELRQQNEVNEADVPVGDAGVHDALGEKGEDER